MKSRIIDIFTLLTAAAMFLLGMLMYPALPGIMATHWGASGQVNGYMKKEIAVYLMPSIALTVFITMYLIKRAVPRSSDAGGFDASYSWFNFVFMLFMFVINATVIMINMGYKTDIISLIPAGMGIIMYSLAAVIEKTGPNPFVGIRTYYTLTEPEVWAAVHKKAGYLLRMCSPVIMAGIFFPALSVFFVLVPVTLVIISLSSYGKKEYEKVISARRTAAEQTGENAGERSDTVNTANKH